MRDSVPFNAKARHGIGERCVNDIGTVLVRVTNELVGATTDLSVERIASFCRFIDVFDVAVIGRNAVGNNILGIIEDLANTRRQLCLPFRLVFQGRLWQYRSTARVGAGKERRNRNPSEEP